MFLECVEHGTARFVCMGAVAESAFAGQFENFGEEMTHFVGREFHRAESSHSWSIDNLAATGKIEHFRKCGGVHAGVVGSRYLTGAKVETGNECIDQRALPDTGISR